MYIIIAILVFGLLIAVHEFGHFIASKSFGVKVNEFAIGMGPAIIKKQGKETLYSLRVLPIGGYCAMEGEDEDSGDTRAFTSQPYWKRGIILAAGAFMNLLTGFLIVVVLFSSFTGFAGTTISALENGFPNSGANGLMAGDTIYSVNGERLYYSDDFSTFMSLNNADTVNLVIVRNGQKISLNNYPLTKRDYMVDGQKVQRYGITFNRIEATPLAKFKYSCYSTYNFVRLIRVSFAELLSGSLGLKDLSGPVGIVSTIDQVGKSSASVSSALANIAYLCAFIAVNLAVMNMLPIPALDGGRIFFMIVTWAIEKISRKHIDPKYEGYVHMAGFVLLMGLMVVVMVNDVVKVIHG